jgi:hypothetical protein
VKKSAQAGGTAADVRTERINEVDLLAWVAPESGKAKKRR